MLCCVVGQICMNQCSPDDRYCEKLQSWSIRLETELVLNKQYLVKVEPGGVSFSDLFPL